MTVCEVCKGKRYVIATRDDGWQAVESCDECSTGVEGFVDTDAAILAREDGIRCAADYPCYLEE